MELADFLARLVGADLVTIRKCLEYVDMANDDVREACNNWFSEHFDDDDWPFDDEQPDVIDLYERCREDDVGVVVTLLEPRKYSIVTTNSDDWSEDVIESTKDLFVMLPILLENNLGEDLVEVFCQLEVAPVVLHGSDYLNHFAEYFDEYLPIFTRLKNAANGQIWFRLWAEICFFAQRLDILGVSSGYLLGLRPCYDKWDLVIEDHEALMKHGVSDLAFTINAHADGTEEQMLTAILALRRDGRPFKFDFPNYTISPSADPAFIILAILLFRRWHRDLAIKRFVDPSHTADVHIDSAAFVLYPELARWPLIKDVLALRDPLLAVDDLCASFGLL